MPPTRALERIVETTAALANPPNLPSRDTRHECVIGDIMGDYSASGNESRTAHSMATHDGRVGAERGTLFNKSLGIDAMDGEMGARGDDIGKDAAWATEDIIFNFDTFVDRNVILDADT